MENESNKKEKKRAGRKNRVVRNQFVTPYKKKRSRAFRSKMTPAEKEFWEMVRNRRLSGLKFRRQQVIDGFIVDFYCNSIGLCVEIDGGIHLKEEQAKRDRHKDAVLSSRNLTVLRFRNEDVFARKEMVYRRILDLTPRPPLLRRGEGGPFPSDVLPGALHSLRSDGVMFSKH